MWNLYKTVLLPLCLPQHRGKISSPPSPWPSPSSLFSLFQLRLPLHCPHFLELREHIPPLRYPLMGNTGRCLTSHPLQSTATADMVCLGCGTPNHSHCDTVHCHTGCGTSNHRWCNIVHCLMGCAIPNHRCCDTVHCHTRCGMANQSRYNTVHCHTRCATFNHSRYNARVSKPRKLTSGSII